MGYSPQGSKELDKTEATEQLSLLLFKMLVYVGHERGWEHLAMITLYHLFFFTMSVIKL